MKRIILTVAAMLSVAVSADAQSTAQAIEKALLAAPARGRDAITVIRWNADYTYETLREGTNQMVCYDRSGDPGQQPFAVQCTVLGNLERVAQNRRFEAGGDGAAVRAMVAGAEESGARVLPVFGSIFISMDGSDQASARTHTTIAVPGATTATIGFPENGREGGAWIMGAGSSGAHIMTPGH